ncbi:MAG: IS4 family transposase [Chloroflexota bacterium]|nr:IS4 family transposase [Chloroflexota bacterium]
MADDVTEQGWVWSEFRGAELGDDRLVKRLIRMTHALSQNPEESLPGVFGGEPHALKAVYRFLDNDDVDPKAILAAHRDATLRRIKALDCKLILGVEDTTYFDFTTHRATAGLGSIGAPGLRGCLHHGLLALEPEAGLPLGLLYSHTWARPEDQPSAAAKRKRPIADKESGRWLEALTASAAVVPRDVRMVTIADREADIFEFFHHADGLGQEVLIRANHDRNVLVAGEAKSLWDAALTSDVLGAISFTVPRDHKHNRPQREALATLHVAEVQLRPPAHLAGLHLAPVTIRAILLQEIDAPADQEPVQWLLLTTLPVQTLDDARQCVIWYGFRWRIERLHYTLKSGGNYEKLQLQTAERLWRALAIYLVVAWRVLYVDLVGRTYPTAPCTTFLNDDEWQALGCHHLQTPVPPAEPPDARTAVRWIAKLGGFLGRRSDGEPGVLTLWRGFRRLQDLVEMWRILRPRE